MGTTLRISILLNCTLLGCLAFLLLTGRRGPLPVEVSATADNPSPVTEVAIPVPLAAPTAEARPFYWRQIESADYRIYIANLRAIGCPEQTIRDIITADVDSLCAARRQPLEARLAASSFAGRLAAEAELRELHNQEASTIAALLLAPPATVNRTPVPLAEAPPSGSIRQEASVATLQPQVSQSAAPSARELNHLASEVAAATAPSNSVREPPADTGLAPQVFQISDPSAHELRKTASDAAVESAPVGSARQQPPETVPLPLVLQRTAPSAEFKLNADQVQAINGLRQNFIEDVGGPNQDPNDPAYSQRWQASQPQADLDLRGMIGISAWQSYQMSAWFKAHEPTPSTP